MAESLPTRYQPKKMEKRIYARWLEGNFFHSQPDDRDPYCMVLPPPNVTGVLHLGHALNGTVQDILIRMKRMQGYNTLWIPGVDHAGIATQSKVESELLEKEGKTRNDIGRQELVRRIWAWKEEHGDRIIAQLKLMGCSCDWSRTRFTLDDVCTRAVRHTFFKFFRDGLIYRGLRLVNWDTQLQTAVADDEVYHETVRGKLWHIKYPLVGGGGHLTVVTIRPETMLGDTAVAVHPEDERYKHLVGKRCILPLMEREIPIIADRQLVKREFGSGVVKVTPAHDPNDYECGKRHNLDMINILMPNGRINANGGGFAGLDRYVAREAVVQALEEQGLIAKVEDYETDIGHSDRSKTPIEPYLSEQWFLKMADLAQQAMDVVEQGRVKFYPPRYAKTYLDWLGEKRDWCISRQLWWGHRIPIWYCDTCSEEDLKQVFADRKDICWLRDEEKERWLICPQEEDLAEDALGEEHKLVQEPDVLDTWFSSALWPFSTLGWPQETPDLKYYYPTSVLITARGIITQWVARMLIAGFYDLGEIPFHRVYIHPMILDGEGRIMSKSLGNGVDPVDIIEKFGADALRFSLAYMNTETQDLRMPVRQEKLADGRVVNTSDKFEIGRNFCNKLWNASRFVMMNLEDADEASPPAGDELSTEDRWVLSRLDEVVAQVTAELEERFGFASAANTLYQFVWHQYCDWYLELAKRRLDAGGRTREIAQRVLTYVLDTILRLLHPIMPFITEGIWGELGRHLTDRSLTEEAKLAPSEDLIIASWPTPCAAHKDPDAEAIMAMVQDIVRAIRHLRRMMNVEATARVKAVVSLADDVWLERLKGEGTLVEHLAGVSELEVGVSLSRPPASAAEVVGDIQVYLPLAGVVNVKEQKARLAARLERMRSQLHTVEKKLDNAEFTSKAPEEIVARERQRQDDLVQSIRTLEDTLSGL